MLGLGPGEDFLLATVSLVGREVHEGELDLIRGTGSFRLLMSLAAWKWEYTEEELNWVIHSPHDRGGNQRVVASEFKMRIWRK